LTVVCLLFVFLVLTLAEQEKFFLNQYLRQNRLN